MSSVSVLDGIEIGHSAESSHLITGKDLVEFARVSGDSNPIHLDDDHARAAGFERRIAHGALVSSYLSSLMGNRLPGRGSVVVKSSLRFMRPVMIDEVFTARVEVVDIRRRFGFVILRVRGLIGEVCCCEGESYTRVSPSPDAAS